MSESWFVYILECENGSFYTGFTSDIARRLKEHVNGTIKSKYTRSFKPVCIAGCWHCAGSKANAMTVERLIKGMDRKMKETLVKNPDILAGIIHQRTGSEINVVGYRPEWPD